MTSITDSLIRRQLELRRQRLQAHAHSGRAAGVEALLAEVDAVLGRLDGGTFGLCEVCHDDVEHDRLLADPLCRFCLDHLTPAALDALERDLELAGRIQAGLLPPRALRLPGWELSYHYEAVGAVSGDYCDVLTADDGRAPLLLLGDVSGKGVAASLLMANLHAIFRSLAELDTEIESLVGRANRLFATSSLPSSYATLVCARVDRDGTLDLTNAGHPAPLVRGARGVRRVPAAGLPLGLFADGGYAAERERLAPGDVLVSYTDGLTEATSPAGQEYGADRVEDRLRRTDGGDARAVLLALLEDWHSHRGGTPLGDDCTVLVLRRE